MTTKRAKDLQPGDKIKMDDGSIATVKVAKWGFVRYDGDTERSVYLEHTAGWSQLPSNQTVELAS